MHADQRRWRRLAPTYLLLIVLSLVYLAPFAWQVSSSLKPLDEVWQTPPRWFVAPHWSNYVEVFRVVPFGRYLVNTALITAAAVAGQVLSGALVAYAFARLRWPGRDLCFVLVLSTLMLPHQVLMVPQYLIFGRLGWIDTYKPLVVPFYLGGSAFYIFLLRQYFLTIPRELEEAAKIDGAGHWRIFWDIILPNAKPALLTVAVLCFLARWHDLLAPVVYLNSFEKYTVSVGLTTFRSAQVGYVNRLMAAATIALVPVVVLFFFTQRVFTRGLALTGRPR
jgi:ABC-type glycerol-3-phosphate transport system permease component